MAIFISGTGRCGTALLGAIFQAHPALYYFPEPRFLSDPGGLCDWVTNSVDHDKFRDCMVGRWRRQMVKKLRVHSAPMWQYAERVYTREFVGDLWDSEVQKGRNLACYDGGCFGGCDRMTERDVVAASFVGSLFEPMVSATQASGWVEKTPHTMTRANVLNAMFPMMRMINMIRRPVDIYASLLKQHWGPKSPPDFVQWYNGLMTTAWEARRKCLPGTYMVVELETLVAQPVATLGEICRFVGIEFQEHLCARISQDSAHVGDGDQLGGADLIAARCNPLYEQWQKEA